MKYLVQNFPYSLYTLIFYARELA